MNIILAGGTGFIGKTLVALDAGRVWRLSMICPATVSALGFIQARMHFCAAFGMGHLFNFGPGVGNTEFVPEVEFQEKDKKKAWQIISYSLLIGAIVALAAYIL